MKNSRNLDRIVLYELEGCPYCQKVIEKLDSLGLEYESVKVPSEKSERDKVRELTDGSEMVPVIQDPNTDSFNWMNESDDIVEYLEEEYGSEDENSSNTDESQSLIQRIKNYI